MQYGMKVTAAVVTDGVRTVDEFRNVTEIHYSYNRSAGMRLAIESNIHGNVATHDLNTNSVLHIREFTVTLETEIADGFLCS